MRKETIVFRCAGRRDREAVHYISVDGMVATCSCNGVDWCSHIDATIVCGERHMVPLADRPKADQASRRLLGRIRAPEGWLATWKEDRVWRGQAPPRDDPAARMRWDGRPTVCFIGIGSGGNRREYVAHAESLGWRVVDRATTLTTLVVSSDAGLDTSKGVDAVILDLPIVDHSDWDEWCYDLTDEIMARIEHHGIDPTSGTKVA